MPNSPPVAGVAAAPTAPAARCRAPVVRPPPPLPPPPVRTCEEGVGTLVPPGRSIAAGTTATVAEARDRQASAAPVAATASMALRRIPAEIILEYPAAGTVPGGPRGCRGSPSNYTF